MQVLEVVGPIIWCDNPQARMGIILYINNNDFHHLGRSQMCAGACDYFSPSKPNSGKLVNWYQFYLIIMKYIDEHLAVCRQISWRLKFWYLIVEICCCHLYVLASWRSAVSNGWVWVMMDQSWYFFCSILYYLLFVALLFICPQWISYYFIKN